LEHASQFRGNGNHVFRGNGRCHGIIGKP
jgi:hypothetical protein